MKGFSLQSDASDDVQAASVIAPSATTEAKTLTVFGLFICAGRYHPT